MKFIMNDGDAQQQNEVLRAMDGIFPYAIESGYGRHIGKYFHENKHPHIYILQQNLIN